VTGSQPSHPFGEYVAKTLGYKKVAVFGTDYAFGYEVVGGFQRSFEEAGGQIVQKLWAPLGASDLAPYITQLSATPTRPSSSWSRPPRSASRASTGTRACSGGSR